jgi:hypothetical protein
MSKYESLINKYDELSYGFCNNELLHGSLEATNDDLEELEEILDLSND